MVSRRSKFLSKTAFAGAGCGVIIALAIGLLSALTTFPLPPIAALGTVAAGYCAGVLLAYRRQEIEDVGYILRLREELRVSQDHIMETATFQALGAYLEIAAHQIRQPLQTVRS